jgi:hypothetical protein
LAGDPESRLPTTVLEAGTESQLDVALVNTLATVQESRPRSAQFATVHTPTMRTASPRRAVVVASKNFRIGAVSPSIDARDRRERRDHDER